VLWRLGTVQAWLRAHIWVTLLTIPLVILHTGFRLGGPMTTFLIVLYGVVMGSGIYGLALQHYVPKLMKERLPAEAVYEQIPFIRSQLCREAEKMRDALQGTASSMETATARIGRNTESASPTVDISLDPATLRPGRVSGLGSEAARAALLRDADSELVLLS